MRILSLLIGPIGLLRAKRQLAVAPVAMALPFRSPQISDTCPENFYCLVYEQQFPNSNGHCCPKPKSACPVGEPDPNAKCNGFEIGGAARQQCNFHTHYCFQPGVVGILSLNNFYKYFPRSVKLQTFLRIRKNFTSIFRLFN